MFVFLVGVTMIFRGGLKPSIDFTGGSLLEIEILDKSQDLSALTTERIDRFVKLESIQHIGNSTFILRAKNMSNEQKDTVIAELESEYGAIEQLRFESVGPVLGRELLLKTIFSVLIVAVVIMLYVMNQFKDFSYGVSAIFAMLHDTFVLFSVFALFGVLFDVEIDALFVTAVLTTLSFSVHDTIVVFDRIREIKRKEPKLSIKQAANAAVIATFSRSLNNSLTIIIVLTALVFLGGETLKWFAVALLVGSITGTYSSTFTAIPLLLLWEDLRVRFQEKK